MTMARRSLLGLLDRTKLVIRDPEVTDAVAASKDILAKNKALVAELAGVERRLSREITRGEGR